MPVHFTQDEVHPTIMTDPCSRYLNLSPFFRLFAIWRGKIDKPGILCGGLFTPTPHIRCTPPPRKNAPTAVQ